jgi:hypothetical protein
MQEVDMNGRIGVNRLPQIVVGAVAAFGLVAPALANPGPSTQSVTITVFADRYIVDDLAFDDLDYLEKHITTTHFHSVELLICGPRATRPLKAVVHRFRHVPVQMRVPDVDEFECMSKAPLVTPVRQPAGRPPFGIDDEAVERYWLDIMP